MYNRTRSVNNYTVSYRHLVDAYTETYSDGAGPGSCTSADFAQLNHHDVFPIASYQVGTIEDVVTPRLRFWDNTVSHNDVKQIVAKPVHHLSKKLIVLKDDTTFVSTGQQAFGGCIRTDAHTTTTDPLTWLTQRFGQEWVKEFYLDSVPSDLSGETFHKADWFSLTSKFNEALDSLIPSSFFAGESFAEGSIYLDAIKAVISPRKVVSAFFKDVERRGLKRFTLGKLDHHYGNLFHSGISVASVDGLQYARDLGFIRQGGKELVNASLLYKFGVKPAIQDIKSTLASHSKVQGQLDYYAKNAGQYVPIRVREVRKDSPQDYEAGNGLLHVGVQRRLKMSVSCISAFGRLRADINQSSKWRAYAEYFSLNKVVGTAWELIPYSFVIDWFTNAQERINDLTRIRLGEGPFLNLRAISSSVKNSVFYDTVLYPGYDTVNGLTMTSPNDPTPLLHVEVSDYTRTPGIPDTSGVVDVSTLGLFHGVTAGQLLIQKLL